VELQDVRLRGTVSVWADDERGTGYAVNYSRTMMEAGDGGSRARHVSGQDFLALTQGKPSCQPRPREIGPAGRPGRPIRTPVRQAIGIGLDDLPFLDNWAFPFIILGGDDNTGEEENNNKMPYPCSTSEATALTLDFICLCLVAEVESCFLGDRLHW
jgi:hypothetical protein